MTGAVKTAIVVPIHNAFDCVAAVTNRLDLYNAYMPRVLVDDASAPETAVYLQQQNMAWLAAGRATQLLRNARQQLFTRSVNRGVRWAYREWRPQYFAIVNSDCDLGPGWLSSLTEIADNESRVGIVGYPDQPEGGKPLPVRTPAYITGHCFLVRRELFEAIGVFCETDTDGRQTPELAGLHGQAHIGSDRIFSWRAQAAGWQTVYCQEPRVGHPGGQSWGHDLAWLAHFDLQPLWEAGDTLEEPVWIG